MKDKAAIKGDKTSNNYTITTQGSLGLLALGDKGLRAWRKVRDSQKIKNKK